MEMAEAKREVATTQHQGRTIFKRKRTIIIEDKINVFIIACRSHLKHHVGLVGISKDQLGNEDQICRLVCLRNLQWYFSLRNMPV